MKLVGGCLRWVVLDLIGCGCVCENFGFGFSWGWYNIGFFCLYRECVGEFVFD